MSTIPIGRPRIIDASMVDIGDDISVEYPEERGVTTTLRGVIAKRMMSGQSRYFMTKDGATLVSWEPNKKSRVKVTLFGREEFPQETLDFMDEVRSHIA